GAVLFIAAMLLGALGVIGDLLAAQRTLSQRTFERVRRIELQLGIEPSHYEPGTPTEAHEAAAQPQGAQGVPGVPGAQAPQARATTGANRPPDPGDREALGV
ncbi:MAG TPA: hypothetical protein VG223_11720, partial [Solirubrobacteraceae bacterium]|nr:hypothetical protein [Solirubrobacteraceae bacterium]